MPYIKQKDREKFDYPLNTLNQIGIDSPGELNYLITKLLCLYMIKGKNYQHINDVLGALEGAKLEFYRRVAVDYEEKKIKENGDV
jgi:hypothetical protein